MDSKKKTTENAETNWNTGKNKCIKYNINQRKHNFLANKKSYFETNQIIWRVRCSGGRS